MTSRHLISLDDLSRSQLYDLVERGAGYARQDAGRAAGAPAATGPGPLAGQVVGTWFQLTSTRTRGAFSVAALRLGGQLFGIGPDELQIATGETLADTGAVLGRMLDALVVRGRGDSAALRAWAAQGRMSVVNAMSDDEHPTQGLTDLTTLHCQFGAVEGLQVLYLGEGNNTAAALALGLSRFPGTRLELRTPAGYGLPGGVLARALAHAEAAGSQVVQLHHLDGLPADVDAIYTSRWQTTGTGKSDPDWRARFEQFRVTSRLWDTSPKAVFLHDLPAHRGDEVSADVLDGPASVAFEQAAHKLHSAMAVLDWCRESAR